MFKRRVFAAWLAVVAVIATGAFVSCADGLAPRPRDTSDVSPTSVRSDHR